MDASTFGVRLACALRLEELMARNTGLPTVLVGIGCRRGVPSGPVISCGVAGGITPGLTLGSVISANHIVDEDNETIWEGEAVKISGAMVGKIVSARRIHDSRRSRKALYEETGAIAIETESYALAGPTYKGCVRTISDTPEWPLVYAPYGGLKALLELRKIRLETKLW